MVAAWNSGDVNPLNRFSAMLSVRIVLEAHRDGMSDFEAGDSEVFVAPRLDLPRACIQQVLDTNRPLRSGPSHTL
jgi:hypothetical protein